MSYRTRAEALLSELSISGCRYLKPVHILQLQNLLRLPADLTENIRSFP